MSGCGSGAEPASGFWKVAWLDSPGLHVEASLGKILNPKCKSICMIDIMQH